MEHKPPRLLVTGFGPFPGAPKNPTERLVKALAKKGPESFGASAVRAVVLPTEYRRSWNILERLYASFSPDVVVHFGLSARHRTIRLERQGRNIVDSKKADAAGCFPSGRLVDIGPDVLSATLPLDAVHAALHLEGFRAVRSNDAGRYVCNATLYRSLQSSPPETGRSVGFVHVPPEGAGGFTADRLRAAATIILREALAAWTKQ